MTRTKAWWINFVIGVSGAALGALIAGLPGVVCVIIGEVVGHLGVRAASNIND